ncbi:hypothetical protein [Streptomonospora wellingtoniae]|uniref:DUF4232 domain-containing protein n=1 Tax=Streptomonospora wellingtoniae TaxID=3075544 RepID=A0ABU2KXT4_9ACTN|nr:hypothetical protein [Streptomonospora sp. DSM 45055]MDT0304112.1 hypothetical protein [Streptomonospora sp. DSM 45055]
MLGAVALLTASCVGASGEPSSPGAVPTPGDAENRAELAEVLPQALEDAESASWRLQSFDSSGLMTVNQGRLSCGGDGSGTYVVEGDATRSTPEQKFVPGREFDNQDLVPAQTQAAGSVATDDGLHADGGFWPVDDSEIPTEYAEDVAAARGANCSHITATIATSGDLRLVGAIEIEGAPVAHWKGTAYIDELQENATGYARQDYAALTAMDLGEAAVDVELWVDADNRPVAYYQNLPPDRTGLQPRWFALSLLDWNEGAPVAVPGD